MATYYVLKNAGLPDTQTIIVQVPDGQVLSPIFAAGGWSVVSSSSDAPDPASAQYGTSDLVVLWRANTRYPANAKVLLPDGKIGTPVAAFTTGSSYDSTKWTVLNDVGAGGGGGTVDQQARDALAQLPGTYVPSLADATVSGASAALAAGATSAITSAGATVTAPAPSGSYDATKPQRFGVTNQSSGLVTVSLPNVAGATIMLTLLPGEGRVYRQSGTLGYRLEAGIPLAQQDARYGPNDTAQISASGALPASIANLLANPDLASSATGWVFGAGDGTATDARVPGAGPFGGYAYVVTFTAAPTTGAANFGPVQDLVPVTAGRRYHGDLWAFTSVALTVRLVINWYSTTSQGSLLSQSAYDVAVPANTWTLLAIDAAPTAPATAAYASVAARITDLSTVGTPTLKFARAKLTATRQITPYRDARVVGSTRSGFGVCHGNSLTQGAHGGGTSFPAKLATELGYTVLNRGRGGETAAGIAVRQGGRQLVVTFPSNTIPASASATVTVAGSDYFRPDATWMFYGSIGGVEGTLTRNANVGTWAWTRDVPGSAVTLLPGGTPFNPATAVDYADWAVIWPGENDIDGGTIAGVQRATGAMAARCRRSGQPFVVVSLLNNSGSGVGTAALTFVKTANAYLASTYGDLFLDLRSYLITNGLVAAGLTPTGADTAAIADERIPPSLLFTDGIHLNDIGRSVAAKYLAAFISSRILSSVDGGGITYVASSAPDLTVYDAQLTALRSGTYYAGRAGAVGTSQMAEGSLRGSPLLVGRTCTIDTLALEVTTAGSAGAVLRLALALYDPAANTSTLLVDGGTVDATATGVKTVAVSVPVTKGQIIVPCAVTQGGATTRPTIRVNGGADSTIGDASAATVSANVAAGFQLAAGVSGAISSSLGSASFSASNGPARVLVKAT